MAVNTELQCEANNRDIEPCIKRNDDFVASLSSSEAMSLRYENAAIAAFVPIPIAWCLVFLVLGIARWIKRGGS